MDILCLSGLDNGMVALGRGLTTMKEIYLSSVMTGDKSLFLAFACKTSHGWMNHGLPEPAKPLQAQANARGYSTLPVGSFDTSIALN